VTTVRYGDTVPVTGVGRLAAVFLMLTGVGVFGVLAGTLASFFRVNDARSAAQDELSDRELENESSDIDPVLVLVEEVAELRREVERLRVRLDDDRRSNEHAVSSRTGAERRSSFSSHWWPAWR
jgi:hypothetical protein